MSLPRLKIQVEVSQSDLIEVVVPESGKAFFNINHAGFGSLYVKQGKELTLIHSLDTEQPAGMLDLLPGNYLFVFRAEHSDRSFQTVEKEFTIKSGKSTRINL